MVLWKKFRQSALNNILITGVGGEGVLNPSPTSTFRSFDFGRKEEDEKKSLGGNPLTDWVISKPTIALNERRGGKKERKSIHSDFPVRYSSSW